mmetsp:Transcript_148496/g.475333  ORF Transcript_148496/g.475333 Transcript_148496/m.475333 type:complete len:358 (+) Transcript_148496:66-1139(+)
MTMDKRPIVRTSSGVSDGIRSSASGAGTPEADAAAAKRGARSVEGGTGVASPAQSSPTATVAEVREALWVATTASALAGAQARRANAAPGGAAPGASSVAEGGISRVLVMDIRSGPAPDPANMFPIPRHIVDHLMTVDNCRLLTEGTGAVAEWNLGDREVVLIGSADQVSAAKAKLQRLVTHCVWGVYEEKVRRLLSQRVVETMLVRLSPMGASLKPVEKELSTGNLTLSMGKDRGNDVLIMDDMISRQHCVLELDSAKGCVYVVDYSTNGTYLNGKRLPPRTKGKIVLSHGDELSMKDPAQDSELAYVVNLVDPSWPPPADDEADEVEGSAPQSAAAVGVLAGAAVGRKAPAGARK